MDGSMSMEGVMIGSNGHFKGAMEDEKVVDAEESLAKHEAQDEALVLRSAVELEKAITALLQLERSDPADQMAANDWLTQFVTKPFAWTAALYVAFPPALSGVGTSVDVRYFTLNVLLGKIRSDWIQLGSDDALDVYQTLLAQLHSNLSNPWFASRLLVLVSAAAAVAGEQAARQLVQHALGADPIVEGPLAYDLLTAVAEEILLRARTHSEEVAETMRDMSPEVLQFLDNNVRGLANPLQKSKIFVCLESWINAGFTLSELYSTYPNLLKALFDAIGSQDDNCFEAAVSTLLEFISAVDGLPEREAAVRETLSAILAHRGLYKAAAAGSSGELEFQYLKSRSRGLLRLVSTFASSEASFLAQGSSEAASLLDWLVDASSGGGGLLLEGATIAAVAWPRLAAVPLSRRSDFLQAPLFATGAQAVLQAGKYTLIGDETDISGLEDDLLRYREGAAADALASFFEQLGTSFLSHMLIQLQQAVSWQSAEVCLFAVATLSREIKAAAGLADLQTKVTSSEGEQVAARSFLSAVFVWVSASYSQSTQELKQPNWRLVQTTLQVVEKYAEWTAIDLKSLEAGLQYTMSALKINNVRGCAANALGSICRNAAPQIVAAQALPQVFGVYELALPASDWLDAKARLALVEGLSVVASFLPQADAQAALKSITFTAVSTIKAVAEMRAPANINGQALAVELRVLAAAVSFGCNKDVNPGLHPALSVLRDIWPALDVAAGHWAGDADAVTALCELWGIVATRLGTVLSAVLPSVIRLSTTMYKQHLVPACLDCLSNIVLLGPVNSNISSEVEDSLVLSLIEVAGTVGDLEIIVEDPRFKRPPGHQAQAGSEVELGDEYRQKAEACLCLISTLARSFLHNKPHILLVSKAFLNVIQCAVGCIRRAEMESALAAAKLLSETILCLSFSEDDFKGKVVWQLQADLVPQVDAVVGLYGAHIIEVALQTLSRFQLSDALREAVSDVLYGLCMRYPGETKATMEVTLNAQEFPARKGVLKESDKAAFISYATQQPVQPRRRFHELVNLFCQVSRGSVPAEAFSAYRPP